MPATDSLPWRPVDRERLLAGVVLSSAVLFTLTLLAVWAPRSTVDMWLLREIQAIDLGYAEPIVFAIDQITASIWANSLLMVAVAGALVLRKWSAALALALLPVARFANHMLSRVVDRERPSLDVAVRVVETTAASFPSGHVIGAVSFYGLLFLMAGRIEHAIGRRLARGICVLVIALVGFGRIWYGAHFPSDVLAAYVLAMLSLCLIVLLCQSPTARAMATGARRRR